MNNYQDQNLAHQINKLTATVCALETDVEDLDAILNGKVSILSKVIVLQINHLSHLYDLIYELATPNNAKDLMSKAEAFQASYEKEVEEIFPQGLEKLIEDD